MQVKGRSRKRKIEEEEEKEEEAERAKQTAQEEPAGQLCEESSGESARQPQGKQMNILLTFYSDHNMYYTMVGW